LTTGQDSLLAEASCHQLGILDLMKLLDGGLDLQQICLLDPKAEHELSPTDDFSCFLFGASQFLVCLPQKC
jgi:ribosome biogenesis SPOUT family RNA methylase Rps3